MEPRPSQLGGGGRWMGRRQGRPPAPQELVLSPQREACRACGQFMRVAYNLPADGGAARAC